MPDQSHLLAAARRAILEGRGRSSGEARQRAFAGDDGGGAGSAGGDHAAVHAYLAKVRAQAYRITDEDVAALRAAGLDDDQIFELTVAAAMGQASRQYDAAVAALDAALALAAKEGAA